MYCYHPAHAKHVSCKARVRLETEPLSLVCIIFIYIYIYSPQKNLSIYFILYHLREQNRPITKHSTDRVVACSPRSRIEHLKSSWEIEDGMIVKWSDISGVQINTTKTDCPFPPSSCYNSVMSHWTMILRGSQIHTCDHTAALPILNKCHVPSYIGSGIILIYS